MSNITALAGSRGAYARDARTSVVATYAGLLAHLKYLYVVGAENPRARCAAEMALRDLVRRYLEELRLLKSYPDEE